MVVKITNLENNGLSRKKNMNICGNTGCRVFMYKIGKSFALKSTYPKEIIEF